MKSKITANLFRTHEPAQRAGTIQRQVSPGQYLLADDQGRSFYGSSETAWRPGKRVVVKAGIIIGRGAVATPAVFWI